MDSLVAIGVITVLIILNGLFVAAEFAIIGVPRAAIEHRAAQGHRVARVVRDILHDPIRQDRFIATAQLGITFASLGLGMYGEHVLAVWIHHGLEAIHVPSWIAAHAVASMLSITILTYFHIVVGEMVPKALALQQSERTALAVTPPLLWIKTLFLPLVVSLNGIGNGILRLMGVDRRAAQAGSFHTPEELEFVVRESQQGGLLRGQSGAMLRELLEFGDLTAAEAMVPRVRVTGIPVGATPAEVEALIRASRHNRYPVFHGDLDHVLGVIHIKDLVRLYMEGETVREEAARPAPFVPETTELDRVLGVMRRDRAQLVVVMDEHGGTAGIVTMDDLFEEVVGAIEEDESHVPAVRDEGDGLLRVMGTARLDELGERLGVVLEHDEVDTVSGLVLDLLGRPPLAGDAVEYDGVRLEVAAVRGHGVAEALARLVDEPPAETPSEE